MERGGSNTAEARRWLATSEKLLAARDLHGTKSFAIRAREANPSLEEAEVIIQIADVLLASEFRINNHPDWYAVLQLPRFTQDWSTISANYRRIGYNISYRRGVLPFADEALDIVNEAWNVLSDPMRRNFFDSELNSYSQFGLGTGSAQLFERQFLQRHQHYQPSPPPPSVPFQQQSQPPPPPPQEHFQALAQEEARARAQAQAQEEARARAQAQAQEEARAKAQAEEQARAKAQAEAQEQARARAQAEAQEQARARAQAEAQELARARARAQEEARAKARAQEEARAKARAQEEARAKARAQEEARAKARAQEEARAKARAQEEARAKARAQEEARSKAQALAQEEARAKARAQAQEQELARAKARELELARAKAQALEQEEARAKARAQEQELARVKAQAQAQEEARAKAGAQEEARAKTRAQAQALEQELARTKAQEQEQARAKAQAQEGARTQTPAQQQPVRRSPRNKDGKVGDEEERPNLNNVAELTRTTRKSEASRSARKNETALSTQQSESTPVGDQEEKCFWTACPYCYFLYEYQKVYEECVLRCQNCKRAFQAMNIPSPPVKGKDDTYFCCWGFIPLGVSGNAKSTNESATWSPFSAMFACPTQAGGKQTEAKTKKPSSPKFIYRDDDVYVEISDKSDESDDDWQSDRGNKRAKNLKGKASVTKNAKTTPTERLRRGNQNANAGNGEAVDGAVGTAKGASKGEPSKKTKAAASGAKKKGAAEWGKLDLNVEFSNDVEEPAQGANKPAQGANKGNGAGNGEEDNIEGIGFFEGLDEFLNSLPILNVVGDDKVKTT
ncbi:hypothetical protein UlMin_032396 [Ulmus minor]